MTAFPPPQTKTAAKPDSAAAKTRKPPRRRIVTFVGVVAIAGLLLAPVFVAKSSLREQILPRLLPDYPAKITTGGASLFWWSSVELTDVAFHDQAGDVLMTVEKIKSEKSLVALLLDQIRVGGFYLENPHLKVRVRADGSNLEETALPLFAPDEDSAGLDYAIHVRGGAIEILDPAHHRQSELREVAADIRVPRDSAEAITVRGTAQVQNSEKNSSTGALDFNVSWRDVADEQGSAKTMGSVRLKTGDLRLQSLSAVIARWNPELEATGVLVSDLAAEWTSGEAPTSFKFKGGLSATNVSLSGPAWMGRDQFRLEYLTQQGGIEYQAGELHLSDLQMKSDVLTLGANGHLNLPAFLEAWKSTSAERSLDDFHLKGDVQIDKIVRMLPETLRLRKGLEIQTGKLHVALDAKTENAEQQLSGQINTSRIAAILDGREIVWDRPLELTVKARSTAGGPILDELACRADFLSLWAQGTPENASFKAACRLDELMTELNRFSDLENWRLSGRIEAGLNLKRLSPNLLRAAGSAVVKDFRFSQPGEPALSPWQETQLVLAAGGDLVSPESGPRRLENVSLRVASGYDELKITQSEPVAWTGRWPNVRFLAELQGDLRSWQNRLKPFLDTKDWRIAGNVVATAQARFADEQFLLEHTIADFRDLNFVSAGLNISETRAHVETKGGWNAQTKTLKLPTTTWASPSLSLRADDVTAQILPEGGPRTSGKLVFRGGLGELSRWFSLDKPLGPDGKLTGTASGQIELTTTAQAADARWNFLIEDASLVQVVVMEPPPGLGFRRTSAPVRTETTWSEERITLGGRGIYDFARSHLELKSMQLEAPWLAITAAGSVADIRGRGDANLTGSMTCDLPMLADRFRKRLPASFRIAGNETRPITLRGPLWGSTGNQRVPIDLAAFTILPCQRLDVYGIQAGPAELPVDLDRGIVRLGPLDAALGTGRMKLDSQIDLTAPELAWQVKKGPLAENIRFTSEVTQGWMQYALPILGGSTETEGQFSAALTSDVVIPLEGPAAMTGSARLAIDSAQMKPGRLANALLDATQQIKSLIRGQPAGAVLPGEKSLIRLERQNVDVQFAGGRVYHQNLKLVLTGIPMTTSGSVGMDESLALTAEIPIQPDWLTQNRLLGGLKGQTLKIPIGGTLSQPRLDARAVMTAIEQATRNATGRILGEELQDQFERLFNRR